MIDHLKGHRQCPLSSLKNELTILNEEVTELAEKTKKRKCLGSGLIKVFNSRATGFHWWAKLFDLYKKNFPLEDQTCLTKSSSEPQALPSTEMNYYNYFPTCRVSG